MSVEVTVHLNAKTKKDEKSTSGDSSK